MSVSSLIVTTAMIKLLDEVLKGRLNGNGRVAGLSFGGKGMGEGLIFRLLLISENRLGVSEGGLAHDPR
jgi:hypothetical protein